MSTKVLGVQLVNSTVDNTPVGSSTPASGAFTQVKFPPNGNPETAVFWIDNPGGNQLRLSNGGSPGGLPVTVDNAGNLSATGAVSGSAVNTPGAVNAGGSVTASAFIGGANSKTNPGYCALPNGFILQWGHTGTIPDGGGGMSVAFPIVFPNAAFSVTATDDLASGATRGISIIAGSITQASFTVHSDGSGNGATWMAIGH